MGVDFPARRLGAGNAAGIDGDDDALGAEALGRLADEFRAMHGGGVDRHLVGAGIEQVADVGDLADAAADGQRHEDPLGGAGDDVEDDAALLAGWR